MIDVYNMNCPNCPNHCAYPGLCTLGMEFFDRMKRLREKDQKTDETEKDNEQ